MTGTGRPTACDSQRSSGLSSRTTRSQSGSTQPEHTSDGPGLRRMVVLMPVLHMVPNLCCDSAAAIELLIESGIEVMHDHPELALQRVVVDRTLSVALDAVVHIGDRRFYRPVRYVSSRIFDDLSYHLF